jgi:hypothetical protein
VVNCGSTHMRMCVGSRVQTKVVSVTLHKDYLDRNVFDLSKLYISTFFGQDV